MRGTKKWITNGMFCDYFVTGCRTDKGFSVLMVERDDNVETKLIKTSYSTAAGTAFVEFNDVKVPVENLLGEEHKGFIVISKFCVTVPEVNRMNMLMTDSVKFQSRALHDVLRRDPAIPHRRRRMPQVVQSAHCLWQAAH